MEGTEQSPDPGQVDEETPADAPAEEAEEETTDTNAGEDEAGEETAPAVDIDVAQDN